jgi:hypothetical protein
MRSFAIFLALAVALGAQTTETFKTRLGPVALDLAMKANIAGVGSATAALSGTKLTISGKFEGLKTNATAAKIRQGTATGVRGAAILDLTVTKATSGTIAGEFMLTPQQIESLKLGKWYVQIDSEKAPEGNLWGWLLK